jgi:hypothetical protein
MLKIFIEARSFSKEFKMMISTFVMESKRYKVFHKKWNPFLRIWFRVKLSDVEYLLFFGVFVFSISWTSLWVTILKSLFLSGL